jgi:hypothetical protein
MKCSDNNKTANLEEMKRELSLVNACYNSVQKFRLVKIIIYKIIILPVDLRGYGVWSLSMKGTEPL